MIHVLDAQEAQRFAPSAHLENMVIQRDYVLIVVHRVKNVKVLQIIALHAILEKL